MLSSVRDCWDAAGLTLAENVSLFWFLWLDSPFSSSKFFCDCEFGALKMGLLRVQGQLAHRANECKLVGPNEDVTTAAARQIR